ncbi:MAG: D-alanyl-D-alanine carboxypeptidase/D-alanyl-D-alanine-endopeptidase [Actinobacteria bacterium]|nr:D-alanyl-D-alanine carboxypeptidase/D-alanyl-D-alanine-endopeptidase [Actinomycetota bacterium]
MPATRPRRPAWPARLALLAVALLLAVTGYLAVGTGRQFAADRSFTPVRVPAPTAAPPGVAALLSAATAAPTPARSQPGGPVPTAAGVAAALAGPLADPELGPSVAGQVFDAGTGTLLFDQRSKDTVAPASTAKLLTAAAVLGVLAPSDRFATRVVAGSEPGTVVLVGGGDPTLSAAPAGRATRYAGAARISDLASRVRAALHGNPVLRVVVDGSAFTGPGSAPGWEPVDTPSAYASLITAAMVDAGRDSADAEIRSAAPDLAAGNALATALGGAEVSLGTAPAGATVLGQVRSAPLDVLVEQMLRSSDNVIAEVLGRQVAIATHRPASFAGAAESIRTVLAGTGVDIGTGMVDASGLSLQDRIPAAALAATLRATLDAGHSRLRPLLSGLSIAGWDGTLLEEDRFGGPAVVADGAVRAKTGTLSGVSAMAGLVTDADGRLLVFSFVADQAPAEGPSRVAVDNLVAALVRCGCR